MSDEQWRTFFLICCRVLGSGQSTAPRSQSWCAWTTFQALRESVHYWSAGVPTEQELGQHGIGDGGTWGQPFSYQSLAHVVIPREFYWELVGSSSFEHGSRNQDLQVLSAELQKAGIPHRATDLVLEIKFY